MLADGKVEPRGSSSRLLEWPVIKADSAWLTRCADWPSPCAQIAEVVRLAMTDFVYPNAFHARLRIEDREWPVRAMLAEVTSIRDRRVQIEGRIWLTGIRPGNWPNIQLGNVVELILPNAHVERVGVIGTQSGSSDLAAGEFHLEVQFLSTKNLRR